MTTIHYLAIISGVLAIIDSLFTIAKVKGRGLKYRFVAAYALVSQNFIFAALVCLVSLSIIYGGDMGLVIALVVILIGFIATILSSD
ncbi:hypothetical protein [uncultured Psychrobacter sp.]|uniref:hypothetical protein n=1 Tax=uncultured Psychrobacter sp. TaxID=259303 RepID=UPI0030D91AAF